MYRHIFPALAAFILTLVMPQLTKAEESLAPATVIVYRADETIRADKLRFDLRADGQYAGRLIADKSVAIQAAPGPFILDTSVAGTDSLTLDLKPGAVYYVHSKLKLTGSMPDVELVEVPEQVARNHGADRMAGAI